MIRIISVILSAIVMANLSAARADDEFVANPTWQAAPAASVRGQVLDWLESRTLDDSVRQQVEDLWSADDDAATPEQLLERVAQTFALTDPAARELVERCSGPIADDMPPEANWLLNEEAPALMRTNLRLVYGRWLAQARLFDTALLYLGGLNPSEVVDPATLLFYRAVAHHRLVDTDASLQAVTRLLEREAELPRRYQQLARLMKEDLKGVEVDSLDHISRRMGDVGRRLDLGQANKRVRDIEDGVIASLDKMIKKLEEEEQRRNRRQQSSSRGAPSGRPMPDSRPARNKGPGKVDKKDIGNKADWGSMPPKEREEAMQQINRDYPSYYRDIIEEYFRRLATENTRQER